MFSLQIKDKKSKDCERTTINRQVLWDTGIDYQKSSHVNKLKKNSIILPKDQSWQ